MSPEVLNDKNITEKSDIYSLGMVLIEMITIEVPYYSLNTHLSLIKQKIKEGIKPNALDRITDEQVKEFLLRLIDLDYNKRPSVSELLQDEFLKIDQKEDNRKIKLVKLKKKRKKDPKKDIEISEKTLDVFKNKTYKSRTTKNALLFKHDFEENPYFEESLKRDKNNFRLGDVDAGVSNMKLGNNREDTFNNEKSKISYPNKNISSLKRESENNINKYNHHLAASSHEGLYTQNSDMNYTANTDYFNNPIYQNKKVPATLYKNENNNEHNAVNVNENFSKIKKAESPVLVSTKPSQLNFEENQINSNHPYQIFDSNYNVHLKFLINQDNKLHEIQFTYNLLRDNIPDLMEEIQNEFNFSHDNLNHIYETLKKISIYSKFYKTSDILHDNSA